MLAVAVQIRLDLFCSVLASLVHSHKLVEEFHSSGFGLHKDQHRGLEARL